MAKKKRRRRLEYRDYDQAMADVERLAAEGKADSEEYEAAIEAATQFFLRNHGSRFFNSEDGVVDIASEGSAERKWFTIKDLLLSMRVIGKKDLQ